MRWEKGQALVEFVLILPVFILLLFVFIDIGRVILCEGHLEGVMDDVARMVYNQDSNEEIETFLSKDNNYQITYEVSHDKELVITLETDIELMTPGAKRFFDNPYRVFVERRILNEQ